MPLRALLLGVFVMLIWGLNFSAIKLAEDVFEPFLLATLRFLLCVVPIILFFPRPRVPFRYVAAYGVVFGVAYFGLLFGGIYAGLSPGLASVVLQLQVFFTILFGVALMDERIKGYQPFGILLGFSGVALTATIEDGSVTIVGLIMVAGAGLSWGLANVIVKKAKPADPLGFMVWSSTVPILPLLFLTILVEGADSIARSFTSLTWASVGGVLFIVYPTTLFGYAVWNTLLKRYSTSLVAPLTLSVPFFGIAGSMVIFGEQLTAMKAFAATLMIIGLAVNQFGGKLFSRRTGDRQPAPPAPAPDRVP